MLSYQTTASQQIFTFLGLFGILLLFASGIGESLSISSNVLTNSALAIIGLAIFGYTYASYAPYHSGIKNNANVLKSLTQRGVWAYVSALVLTAFYVVLYFFDAYLEPMIRGFDFISWKPCYPMVCIRGTLYAGHSTIWGEIYCEVPSQPLSGYSNPKRHVFSVNICLFTARIHGPFKW